MSIKDLSKFEEKLLSAAYDMPDDISPYAIIAKSLGCSEDDVIEGLKALIERGIIRRFGAILKHSEAGLRANALLVAKVEEKDLLRVAELFIKSKNVTHCYQRRTSNLWQYNFYAMIHARTKEELENIANSLVKEAQISDFKLLFSLKEYKKTGWKWGM